MPDDPPRRNRGPAAAALNRAALLEAAGRLFADQGYLVPLSAVAKEAGVGQGVLYRHFPTRADLAFATFAENFEVLEELAGEAAEAATFARVWAAVVDFTISSSGFIDTVIHIHAELPHSLSEDRFIGVIREPLKVAQAAGLADPRWTPHDMVLVLHMLHGVVVASRASGGDRDRLAAAVRRALALVDDRLVPAV